MSFLVGGVRAGGRASAVNGRAARSVGNYHSVAEQLRNKLDVRRFAAACARSGELEQGLLELASLNRCWTHRAGNLFYLCRELVVFLLSVYLLFRGLHNKSLFLGGASVCAHSAAGTVKGTNLNAEFRALLSYRGLGIKANGYGGVFVQQYGTDSRVGANHRALVTLNTFVNLPFGDVYGNTALFVLRGAYGYDARRVKRRYGQSVTLLFDDGTYEFFVVLAFGGFGKLRAFLGGLPRGGNGYFVQSRNRAVDSRPVGFYNLLSLLAVGLNNGGFHIFFRLSVRDNVRKLEERRLHYHIGGFCRTRFKSDMKSVDGVELQLLVGNLVLHMRGQFAFKLFVAPCAV